MNTLIAITATGMLVMISEIFRFRKFIRPTAITGLLVALVLNILDWNTDVRYYSDMMHYDNFAVCFAGLMTAVTIIWFLLVNKFVSGHSRSSDFTTLILFALAGGVVMVSYADLTMLFIGLEILSIAMYIMSATNKSEYRSNEAGFKYLMLGAFATGFLLFGMTLIYGVTGSFNLQDIASYVSTGKNNLPVMFYTGLLLMLVGLSFKVSAAPFHFWAPDVYEGAPTAVTAFMATVVKTAAFAAFLRLFSTSFADIAAWWSPVIAVFAALSMLAGNILAVYQKSFKRMMAFSSISHAGYMLLAIVALNDLSAGALLMYTTAYSIGSIGIFALVLQMTGNGDETVESLRGFAKSNPLAAFSISVLMLSLAGIPPVAGFFAKYYVFYGALQNQWLWLVLVAILSSLIGVYYYFRVIITMYQPAHSHTTPLSLAKNYSYTLLLALVITILLGLVPSVVTGLL